MGRGARAVALRLVADLGRGHRRLGMGLLRGRHRARQRLLRFRRGDLADLPAGYWMPLSRDEEGEKETVDIGFEPNLALGLSIRSGPIVVEVDYRVDPDSAREFYAVMTRMQRMRKRIQRARLQMVDLARHRGPLALD